MNTTHSRRHFLGVLSAGAAATVAPAALAATLAPLADTPPNGPAPALAATSSSDAGLLKLIEDCRTAKAEVDRLGEAYTIFEEKLFARRQKLLQSPPEALRARPEDQGLLPKSAGGHLQYVEDGFYGIGVYRDGPRRGARYLDDVANLTDDKWQIAERLSAADDPLLALAFRWVDPSPAARARADEIIAAHDKLRKRHDRKPAGYRAAERALKAPSRRLAALLASIEKTRARSLSGLKAKAQLAREDSMDEAMALSLVEDLCALDAVQS